MKEIINILIPLLLGGIGFVILKFILDPILKQKSHITQIIEYLISKANIIAAPGYNKTDEKNAISAELRNFSSKLISKTLAIPFYAFFEKVKFIKNKPDIKETAQDLIRLSNSLFEDYHDVRLSNSQTLERMYKRLGIK